MVSTVLVVVGGTAAVVGIVTVIVGWARNWRKRQEYVLWLLYLAPSSGLAVMSGRLLDEGVVCTGRAAGRAIALAVLAVGGFVVLAMLSVMLSVPALSRLAKPDGRSAPTLTPVWLGGFTLVVLSLFLAVFDVIDTLTCG